MRAVMLMVLLLASPAGAYVATQSAEGRICLLMGNTNDPVTTFMGTGLDLIVREHFRPGSDCQPADLGSEVSGFHGGITVVQLVAPNGEEMDMEPLQQRPGSVGRYTSPTPYQFTMEGQYWIRLQGTWDGDEVWADFPLGVPVRGVEDALFPPLPDGATIANLQAQVALLEGKVASTERQLGLLQGQIIDLKALVQKPAPVAEESPLGVVVLLAALGVALLVRRRQ